MNPTSPVLAAEAHVAAARARLVGTFEQVQHRLTSAALAQDAVEVASEGAAVMARSAAEAVRARPFTLAAVVGTIGLIAARGRIARAFHRGEVVSKVEPTALPASSTPRRTRRQKGS